VLAAQADLELKQQVLSDITGLAPQSLYPKFPAQDGLPDEAVAPTKTLKRWLQDAAASNLDVRTQSANLEVARQEAFKSRIASSPSLDLVAKVGRDHLAGNGDFGPASATASSGMIGVQLTVPVFTGGYRSAQHEEAVELTEKARTDEQRTRQQVALQTRAAWLGLTVGAHRVAALSAALDASRARLDATRLGHQIGDRTTLDLLNAEADASSAEMSLLQARIGLLTERLRLAALAGALDEEQLTTVNASLQSSSENNPP
jgi:outer membrane protein